MLNKVEGHVPRGGRLILTKAPYIEKIVRVEDAIIVPTTPPDEVLPARVTKVFDGDGFLAIINDPGRNSGVEMSFRCGFIDAPEMGQDGSEQAKNLLTALIGNRTIYLAILLKADTGGIFDRHKRIVCVPFIAQRNSSGQSRWRNVELEMVVNGWAWVLERYGPEDCYLDALADARHHRRGIWSKDDQVPPWQFKRQMYQHRVTVKPRTKQHDLFANNSSEMPCPQKQCEGILKEKSGRYGNFIGCSNFPDCRYTHNQ